MRDAFIILTFYAVPYPPGVLASEDDFVCGCYVVVFAVDVMRWGFSAPLMLKALLPTFTRDDICPWTLLELELRLFGNVVRSPCIWIKGSHQDV